jgi:hypothetical protein
MQMAFFFPAANLTFSCHMHLQNHITYSKRKHGGIIKISLRLKKKINFFKKKKKKKKKKIPTTSIDRK